MNSQNRVAAKVQPSFQGEKSKVLYSDVFEKKKKQQEQDVALERILARARKSNW